METDMGFLLGGAKQVEPNTKYGTTNTAIIWS
jgi:hypothetical protein